MAILIPWPYEQGAQHVVEYRTDILKSINGTETRITTRREPREEIALDYLLDDVDVHQLRAWLVSTPHSEFRIPFRWEGASLTADASGTEIFLDTTKADWATVANQNVMVEAPDGSYYVGVRQSNTNTSITLDVSPSGGAYNAGTACVYPLEDVKLFDRQPYARWPKNLGKWRLSGRLVEYITTRGRGSPALDTYNSFTVLTERPLSNNLVEEQADAALEFIDYGQRFSVEFHRDNADIFRAHEFSIRTDSQRQWWKKMLDTMVGRRIPFYMATWQDDLVLNSQPAPSATTLDLVDTPDYKANWFDTGLNDRIQVEMEDGTVTWHEVTGIVDDLDGTHTATITPALPGGSFTVAKISMLDFCRFVKDATEFVYFATHGRVLAPVVVTRTSVPATIPP